MYLQGNKDIGNKRIERVSGHCAMFFIYNVFNLKMEKLGLAGGLILLEILLQEASKAH